MYSNKPIIYRKERRKKPDIVCWWLEITSILVWLVLLAALIIYQDAQPQTETFLDRLFGVEVRKTWDYRTLSFSFYLLLFLFVLSTVSLILNFKRLKRSTDNIRPSFIISLVGSVVGMLIYLFAVLM